MTIASAPDKRILIVNDPQWLEASIIVNFGRHAVILPGFEQDNGFYERLSANIPPDNKFEGDIAGKSPDWPIAPLHLLDTE
ncbi:MAG TPA: hypothetical protein VMR52_07605 [Dehalococcoidia bacterium]|nr:hypothetical protein [Dehalococcoidia bacterium]